MTWTELQASSPSQWIWQSACKPSRTTDMVLVVLGGLNFNEAFIRAG